MDMQRIIDMVKHDLDILTNELNKLEQTREVNVYTLKIVIQNIFGDGLQKLFDKLTTIGGEQDTNNIGLMLEEIKQISANYLGFFGLSTLEESVKFFGYTMMQYARETNNVDGYLDARVFNDVLNSIDFNDDDFDEDDFVKSVLVASR